MFKISFQLRNIICYISFYENLTKLSCVKFLYKIGKRSLFNTDIQTATVVNAAFDCLAMFYYNKHQNKLNKNSEKNTH